TGDTLRISDTSATVRVGAGFYKEGVYLGYNAAGYSLNGVVLNDVGYYYLIDSANGCQSMDSCYVNIDSSYTPTVRLELSPQRNVGPYSQLSFTAKVNYGKDSSSFTWYKNGVIIPLQNDSV